MTMVICAMCYFSNKIDNACLFVDRNFWHMCETHISMFCLFDDDMNEN